MTRNCGFSCAGTLASHGSEYPRDTAVFEFFALGGFLLTLAAPFFAMAIFITRESPQLESNLKSLGHANSALLFFSRSIDFLLSYWQYFLAPMEVFLIIAAAKLWVEFERSDRVEKDSSLVPEPS